jgi:hypothetical protein
VSRPGTVFCYGFESPEKYPWPILPYDSPQRHALIRPLYRFFWSSIRLLLRQDKKQKFLSPYSVTRTFDEFRRIPFSLTSEASSNFDRLQHHWLLVTVGFPGASSLHTASASIIELIMNNILSPYFFDY